MPLSATVGHPLLTRDCEKKPNLSLKSAIFVKTFTEKKLWEYAFHCNFIIPIRMGNTDWKLWLDYDYGYLWVAKYLKHLISQLHPCNSWHFMIGCTEERFKPLICDVSRDQDVMRGCILGCIYRQVAFAKDSSNKKPYKIIEGFGRSTQEERWLLRCC